MAPALAVLAGVVRSVGDVLPARLCASTQLAIDELVVAGPGDLDQIVGPESAVNRVDQASMRPGASSDHFREQLTEPIRLPGPLGVGGVGGGVGGVGGGLHIIQRADTITPP